MIDNTGNTREIMLKQGRAVTFTGPVMIFIPEGARIRHTILHAIKLADGEILHGPAPIDENRHNQRHSRQRKRRPR